MIVAKFMVSIDEMTVPPHNATVFWVGFPNPRCPSVPPACPLVMGCGSNIGYFHMEQSWVSHLESCWCKSQGWALMLPVAASVTGLHLLLLAAASWGCYCWKPPASPVWTQSLLEEDRVRQSRRDTNCSPSLLLKIRVKVKQGSDLGLSKKLHRCEQVCLLPGRAPVGSDWRKIVSANWLTKSYSGQRWGVGDGWPLLLHLSEFSPTRILKHANLAVCNMAPIPELPASMELWLLFK